MKTTKWKDVKHKVDVKKSKVKSKVVAVPKVLAKAKSVDPNQQQPLDATLGLAAPHTAEVKGLEMRMLYGVSLTELLQAKNEGVITVDELRSFLNLPATFRPVVKEEAKDVEVIRSQGWKDSDLINGCVESNDSDELLESSQASPEADGHNYELSPQFGTEVD